MRHHTPATRVEWGTNQPAVLDYVSSFALLHTIDEAKGHVVADPDGVSHGAATRFESAFIGQG